ncbi:MAG TPA: hypothetical protein VLZ10_17515 [Thermodesulfobacteriota bacterium]|nr:hypothetical protein [Thermodesulfobacteriota bacterium]
MKRLKTVIVVVLVSLATFLLVASANAQRHGGGHYRGYGHGYGHGYYGGRGYGWWGYPYGWAYPYGWGYPYGWNYPYYPYYGPYYGGGYEVPTVPPEEVTPPPESGQQQQPSYWRFCQDPEGYYPYVKDCPGGWMAVVPSKPNAPPPKLGAPVRPTSPLDKKPEK